MSLCSHTWQHCRYWANHSSINLAILNQLFVQTESRMEVCVVWLLFPVLLCVVIQRCGGNVAERSLFTGLFVGVSVCLAGCGFSHTDQFLLALRLHLRFRSVSGCVCEMCTRAQCVCGMAVSRRPSNLNPEIKGRGGGGCPSLPFNYSVCGEGVRKPRC